MSCFHASAQELLKYSSTAASILFVLISENHDENSLALLKQVRLEFDKQLPTMKHYKVEDKDK